MNFPPSIRCRYLVCFAVWFTMLSLYVHRSNITVAILDMVELNKNKLDCGLDDHDDNQSKTYPYNWTSSQVATITGAYFYGYACMHLIGAILSAKFGCRYTMAIFITGATVFTFLNPLFANIGPNALIAVRVLAGISSGPLIPITHEIVGSWSPSSERSLLSSLTYSGNIIGLIVNYGIAAGVLGKPHGWETFFYISGGLGVVSLILWLSFVFDSPNYHPYISKEEALYITGGNPMENDEKGISLNTSETVDQPKVDHKSLADNDDHHCQHHIDIKKVPFLEILKSWPVWTLNFAHFGNTFILYSAMTGTPKFLSEAYGLSTQVAGLYSMIPYFFAFLAQMIIPFIIKFIKKRFNINRATMTKSSSIIGFTLSSLFIMISGVFTCIYLPYPVTMLSLALVFYGANITGYYVSMIDIAPKYSGIIMGISNTFGSMGGFISPEITAALIARFDTKYGWLYNFIISGIIAIVSGLPYMISGTSKLQKWSLEYRESIESDQTIRYPSKTAE